MLNSNDIALNIMLVFIPVSVSVVILMVKRAKADPALLQWALHFALPATSSNKDTLIFVCEWILTNGDSNCIDNNCL